MSDCWEVITRKRIQTIAQDALENGVLDGAIDNVQTTIEVDEYKPCWPVSAEFTIVIGTEQLRVTAGFGDTELTVTRAYGGTIAAAHLNQAAITPLASRVILGVLDCSPETFADFFNNLLQDGFLIQVRNAKRNTSDVNALFDFTIRIRLYFAYPRYRNYDYSAVENALYALMNAINQRDLYTSAIEPFEVEQDDPDEEYVIVKTIVAKYEIRTKHFGAGTN